jgi:hypothetical protein
MSETSLGSKKTPISELNSKNEELKKLSEVLASEAKPLLDLKRQAYY